MPQAHGFNTCKIKEYYRQPGSAKEGQISKVIAKRKEEADKMKRFELPSILHQFDKFLTILKPSSPIKEKLMQSLK